MKRALIVGINNYPSCPLKGCINDAQVFSKIIETNDDGSPNFEVKLLLDTPTKSDLKKGIVELFSGDCDTTLFYFSGHGFMSDLGGFIVTPDYKKYDEGVSMEEILQLANNSKAKDKIIILDCCHSGAFGSPQISGNCAHISEGVSILTASRADEVSLEVGGHGVFTNLLLHALNGGAADIRGHITPGSVYSYIDQALGAWDQRPVFKTNITRFTSLRKSKPAIPIEALRKITDYFPDPREEFKLDPSYEYTNTLLIEHKTIEPYAKEENIKVFKDLQKYQSVGLVVPVNAEHMYFAAMDSKACKLTALGHHYWRLVQDKRI
jgi:hypothetical protein